MFEEDEDGKKRKFNPKNFKVHPVVLNDNNVVDTSSNKKAPDTMGNINFNN